MAHPTRHARPTVPFPRAGGRWLGGVASWAVALGGWSLWATPVTLPPSSNMANSNSLPATNRVIRLPEMNITGRQDSLVGTAQSASQGTVGPAQLQDRPILRSGEILEAVPGVIITQHAGGGKANQYFLRGFNLDHGTDFAVCLDDMPLNLPSHAHGEGYSDMNTVIPELVERVNYEKGPYYAEVGNYGSAGAAHLQFCQDLPQDFATLEGGGYGYERGVFGISQPVGDGHLLYAGEVSHEDGPWVHPDNYLKYNGLVTYSQGTDDAGWSATFRGYQGAWHSSDQIAASFGQTNFFGTVNPTDGGDSQRYSLQGEWHCDTGDTQTKITAYGFYYHLNLFSDFTDYLVDPVRGDQFEQEDTRWVGGLDARHTVDGQWYGFETENTVGLQLRSDSVNNGLYQTEDRQRVDKTVSASYASFLGDPSAAGATLPAITDANEFTDTQVGLYVQNRTEWNDWLRSVAALRSDLDAFDVTSYSNPTNSGTASRVIPEPKVSVRFGPWDKTEFYVQGGVSFHSNDGRGATQRAEPLSAGFPLGGTTGRIPAIIPTEGGEVGVRSDLVPHLESTLSLWYLHSHSELEQDGDTGGTVASSSPSDRYGVEWSSFYRLTPHLALDVDVADSVARFTAVDAADAAPGSAGGNHVPEATGMVLASGLTLHDWHGFSASLRLRYFGPRDLTSDGAYRSTATLLLNAGASYRINRTWQIHAELLNLLDRRDHDIDYAYESQVTPAAAPKFQDVFHPVEPIQLRVGVTATF